MKIDKNKLSFSLWTCEPVKMYQNWCTTVSKKFAVFLKPHIKLSYNLKICSGLLLIFCGIINLLNGENSFVCYRSKAHIIHYCLQTDVQISRFKIKKKKRQFLSNR